MNGRTQYPTGEPTVNPGAGTPAVTFRASFWRWYFVAVILGQLLFAALMSGPLLTGSWGSAREFYGTAYPVSAAAVTLLMAPGMFVYVRVWTVRVGPNGLRGSDAWGRFVTVPWPSIVRVAPVKLPFLPTVRVFSADTRRVIWLPLFLVDYPRFAELVEEYAGPDHPLTRVVRERLGDD